MPPNAVIDFSANGQNKSAKWATGKAEDPLLSSISVFDCQTANVYVDGKNDVAYTPFPMKVLECLAHTCREIRKHVEAEILELERQTPTTINQQACHPGTAVCKLLAGLDGATKVEDIRRLATLNEPEKARFETLKTDLGSDSVKMARQVEALKTRLDDVNKALGHLAAAVTDERAGHLAALYRRHQTTRAATAAAAGDLFAAEPLSNVGSEVWRALWEAARAYSQRQAYPDVPFPFTEDGARCVLCQQELGTEAVERLVRFERFVKDETKRKEEEAGAAYRTALEEMNTAGVVIADIRAAAGLIRNEVNDEPLAELVRRAAVTAKWRHRAILRNHLKGAGAVPLPKAEAWPSAAIAEHDAVLAKRIASLRAENESEERRKMRAEFEELVDRERLAVIQDDAVAEAGRRKKTADLRATLKDAATKRITTKSANIAERLVTNTLRAQFSKEVDRLNIAGLAIELRKGPASYGVPHFRVSLTRKPDAHIGDILSEGEHRCVALAAFLAELTMTQRRSAIVFDDPVSSLDHVRRDAVAERMADEGGRRQIVVFTHDIAFLFLLDQACRDKGTSIAFRCVTRGENYAGFCQQDPPVRAQRIENVIDEMQKQLAKEKIHYDNGDHHAWERTLDGLQKRLRLTWERAVEEVVGPVIKRLSSKVNTKGLAKITTVTINDCTVMREAYGRCSTLLHSSPDSLNKPLTKPETVQNEITALRDWVTDIKQRQKDIDWL